MSLFGEIARAFDAGRTQTARAKPALPRGPGGGQLGGRSGRVNEWRKCQRQGCWHRVPPGAIHAACMRAWALGPALPPTHQGGIPCCPGVCDFCARCLDRCPGKCSRCGKCLDLCTGHDEEDETPDPGNGPGEESEGDTDDNASEESATDGPAESGSDGGSAGDGGSGE